MRIRLYNQRENTITVLDVKNFEYLPLFYLFPKKLLKGKCPGLEDMPRSVHGILKSEKWFTMLISDYFTQAVCDLTAFYVWPAFGISTHMECFSGHDPMWRLVHATPLWEEAYEHLSSVTPQRLAKTCYQECEWIETEQFENQMLLIGLRGIMDNNLQPCIQAVREMRCPEDYDYRKSNAKNDFYRKWYHTRSRFTIVSLEQLVEG